MAATYALIPAAGRSSRFSAGGVNKILAPLAGKPLLRWTVEVFAAHASVDGIVVVAGPSEVARCREALGGVPNLLSVVSGGQTRQESVAIGLFALGGDPDDLILVHDGARPLVTPEVVTRCIDGARRWGNAVAALPVADTLKAVDGSGDEARTVTRTVDREGLWAVQTPQAFSVSALYAAHTSARDQGWTGTDEASLVERFGDSPVHLVVGDPQNFKITRPDDLRLASSVLRGRGAEAAPPMRIGFGYDIHRLVEGRRLVLGGIEIPSPRGLDGHSDADVLLHALCDALLGAAGLPDIGHLFPNTDPAYKDADSLGLLREVVRRLSELGCRVGNVDLTLLAEAPKIAPFIPRMRESIARCLLVRPSQVGIKATTNEGLGALGRGEGMAAHAVALIVGPS